jgi:hypothetical protein
LSHESLTRVTVSCAIHSYNGNWELAMIEGMASIAVFTEDAALLDHAMTMWRARVPAYFYMASDGPTPTIRPGCDKSNW